MERAGIDRVCKEWIDVAHAIAEQEKVRMCVHPRDLEVAKKVLTSTIEIIEMRVNDGWARDTAPLFLVNEQGEKKSCGIFVKRLGCQISTIFCRYFAEGASLQKMGFAILSDRCCLTRGGRCLSMVMAH